jgi:hypothetical protein
MSEVKLSYTPYMLLLNNYKASRELDENRNLIKFNAAKDLENAANICWFTLRFNNIEQVPHYCDTSIPVDRVNWYHQLKINQYQK